MEFLNKIIVKAGYFEEQLRDQKFIVKKFLSIRNILSTDINKPVSVEFFFYGKAKEEAKYLASDLEKFNYDVYGINKSGNEFSVIGATVPINVNGKEFIQWIEKMNELAFIYNFKFDGYGMLIDKE